MKRRGEALPELLVAAFALAAVVLTVSALASGIVERAPLSFPIIFLGLGFLIGERGFGLLTLGPEDPTLETIAVLTLALVLFLDAVRMEAEEVGGAGDGALFRTGDLDHNFRRGSRGEPAFGHLARRVAPARDRPGLDRPGGAARRGPQQAHPALG